MIPSQKKNNTTRETQASGQAVQLIFITGFLFGGGITCASGILFPEFCIPINWLINLNRDFRLDRFEILNQNGPVICANRSHIKMGLNTTIGLQSGRV